MNKILIIGAGVAVIGIIAYSQMKKTDDVAGQLPASTPAQSDDVFVKYNGYVVVDADGKYILVKDGKFYTPNSLDSLKAWQAANPDKPGAMPVPEKLWALYSATAYAGGF